MRVLITGDRGFIGTHLKKLFPKAVGYDLVDGFDIRNKNLLEEFLEGVDVVVHLAAKISVSESEEKPYLYMDNNISGTASLIESCLKARVKKIVYASSASCYEPSSSPYAMTKYTSELLMQHFSDRINTTSLRFFNIYGEGQNPTYAAVISAFKGGIENGMVTIYGDGKQTRDFISVSDVCLAIEKAVNKTIPSGEVMDIGTGYQTSVLELLKMMETIMGKKPKVFYEKERKEVRFSVADTKKAKRLLGFNSKIILEKGLKEIL
jgi:UDP-glucose 4-epimerase